MEISINCQSSIKIVSDKILYFDPYEIREETHDADLIFITTEGVLICLIEFLKTHLEKLCDPLHYYHLSKLHTFEMGNVN